MVDASNWHRQSYPMDGTRGFVIDHVGGFAILGFVMASIIKPRDPAQL